MEKHLTELLEWYCGEVGGEAFFAALAHQAAETAAAAKWRALSQLERGVAGRVRLALESRGVPIPLPAADLARGLRSAQSYAGLTWRDTLTKLRPELVDYVRYFEAAESILPQELQPLAQFITEHERALLEFVTRELDQDGLHSLDRVSSLLAKMECAVGLPDPL